MGQEPFRIEGAWVVSAMLKNAQEFGDWVAELTTCECVVVDFLWRHSRQARGVVGYQEAKRLRAHV